MPEPAPEPCRSSRAESEAASAARPPPKPVAEPKPAAGAEPPVAQPSEPEPEFNPDDIAALLNKQEPAGGGDPLPSPEPQTLGSIDGHAEAAMTQSEIAALKARLYRCWNPPVAVREAGALVVEVRITLLPDGSLVRPAAGRRRGDGQRSAGAGRGGERHPRRRPVRALRRHTAARKLCAVEPDRFRLRPARNARRVASRSFCS